jgi:hypothetical protein
MSILYYDLGPEYGDRSFRGEDLRFDRELKADIAQGIDEVFKFKEALNRLHPTAKDIIMQMVTK